MVHLTLMCICSFFFIKLSYRGRKYLQQKSQSNKSSVGESAICWDDETIFIWFSNYIAFSEGSRLVYIFQQQNKTCSIQYTLTKYYITLLQ